MYGGIRIHTPRHSGTLDGRVLALDSAHYGRATARAPSVPGEDGSRRAERRGFDDAGRGRRRDRAADDAARGVGR